GPVQESPPGLRFSGLARDPREKFTGRRGGGEKREKRENSRVFSLLPVSPPPSDPSLLSAPRSLGETDVQDSRGAARAGGTSGIEHQGAERLGDVEVGL